MTSSKIQIYTDENIDPRVARQLRRHGYDALSCQDAGNHNQGLDDEWQLAYATSIGRAIVTRDNIDFVLIESRWKASGMRHSGIICTKRGHTISDLIRALRLHVDTFDAELQDDVLIWI